jgi:ectoine hydroxylase-related dioxygenase (phytanoyl-CoA dioxygenase family)
MSSIAPETPFIVPVADTEIGRQFARDGFYVARGVYSPAEVAELERDFDRIVEQLVESGESINATWGGPEMERLDARQLVVLHTHNVQQYSAAWSRSLFHPGFLAGAQAILGPDVVMHHTKLFQKPPEVGAPFPMHQDWEYFPTIKHSMIAGIIHVSRADDEMGCLRVYPGSHRLGPISETSGQHFNQMLEEHPLENATPVEAEPGDVVFFHYFTIHGSLPNRSPHTRKTVLIQLHSGDDKVVDENFHPNERLVLSGWNHHATRSVVNQK